MTAASAELLDRLAPLERTFSGEPAWIQAERSRARAWLTANGLPSARDEAWKYTPLDDILTVVDAAPLESQRSDEAATDDRATRDTLTVDTALVDELAGDHGGPRLVFVNGVFAADLSGTPLVPEGVVCANRASSPDSERALEWWDSERSRIDGFQALNRVAGPDTAVIRIAPGTDVAEPIHVVHLSVPGASPSVSHPRTLVEVAPGARVTIIETYAGRVGRHLTNAATTIGVGRDAEVSHYNVQTQAAGTVHVAHTNIRQAAGSKVHSCSVMLGADIARNAIDVVLAGNDAQLEVAGLYLPTGRQRHDNVVTVEHAASACTSRQLFKGVIDDHARGSFGGRILVRPGTVATDAGQTSRSLLLSPTAQADTRPWLEIRADDVKCTHGATIGRLDADALFYLRTRGIDSNEARTMLIGAFIGEITDRIHLETLRSRLKVATAARL